MKKLIKKGLLSVALLAAVAVNASNKLNVEVASDNSKMLSISLEEVVSGETVYIEDYRGQVLYSENLEASKAYNKVFNLSSLPDGMYFIGSKEDEKIQVTPILVEESGVSLVTESTKTYLAPEVTIEEDVLRVMVRNYNNSEVLIEVFDELGTLLNTAELSSNTMVYGSYEISHRVSKTVTVSVTEGEENFTKEYKL